MRLEYRFATGSGHVQAVHVNDRSLVIVGAMEGDPRLRIESEGLRGQIAQLKLYGDFYGDGAVVLRLPDEVQDAGALQPVLAALAREPHVRWSALGLKHEETEEAVFCPRLIVVRFDRQTGKPLEQRVRQAGLSGRWWSLPWAEHAIAWQPRVDDDVALFSAAARLSDAPGVETCYPIVCHPDRNDGRLVEPSPPGGLESQWHLGRRVIDGVVIDESASVEAAWRTSRGRGSVVSIIDPEEIDAGHGEFTGRVVHPQDVTRFPRRGRESTRGPTSDADHGTFCAGYAVAAGKYAASGVAPEALLLPVRSATALGGLAEGHAIWWAVRHGADVVVCPWSPPSMPRGKRYPLPPHVDWAFEHATMRGRGGRGTVVMFAAGNGTDRMDLNGYAASPYVIAVGACGADGLRVSSSELGSRLWCLFPSGSGALKVWSTRPWDQPGSTGYGWGRGGTSAAVSGAAGVVALMLAVRPSLGWEDVKEILRRTCDKIQPRTRDGAYDEAGHSVENGFGRIHASRAVDLARAWPEGVA